MALNPPGTSGGTPWLVLTETAWSSCTSWIWSGVCRGSFNSCSDTTVLTSGAGRLSFLPLGVALADLPAAAVLPPLAAVLGVSTQWPVSLKHTGSDLLPSAGVVELELGLLAA